MILVKKVLLTFLGVIAVLITSCDELDYKLPALSDQSFYVDENSPGGTEVGTVNISETNGETFAFHIIGGNEDEFFKIDSVSGLISVNENAKINYEAQQYYVLGIEIRSLDSDNTAAASVKVFVNDQIISANGLIGRYTFNGTYEDYSGNNFSASNGGTSFYYSRYFYQDSCISFDGVNDYVLLPNEFDISNKTISVWFNAKNIPVFDYQAHPLTSWQSILTYDFPNLVNGSINLNVSKVDEESKVWVWAGGMSPQISPNLLSASIEEEKWHQITISFSPQNIKLYLDGAYISSVTSTFYNSVDGFENIVIGADRKATGRFLKGEIDNLLIYNRILTDEEIMLIYLEN